MVGRARSLRAAARALAPDPLVGGEYYRRPILSRVLAGAPGMKYGHELIGSAARLGG